jgi:NADH dehydrogenase (ubiquinone) 1 alpha/beta subcomplex 1
VRALANSGIGHGYLQGAYIHAAASRAVAHTLQLNGESHFHNDLGLDSLDTVEVVMAIEEVSGEAGCMLRKHV